MADSKHTSIMVNAWTTTHKYVESKRRVGGSLVTIDYAQYLHWYYRCLSFEEAFTPDSSDLRQLGFVIAISQVNLMLAYNFFWCTSTSQPTLDKATFTRELAIALFYGAYEDCNKYEVVGNCSQQKWVVQQLRQRAVFASKELKTNEDPSHCLCCLDWHQAKWNGHEFPKVASKYICCWCRAKCGREYRTFCFCDWSLMLCLSCYGEHVMMMTHKDGVLWLFFLGRRHIFSLWLAIFDVHTMVLG